MFAHIRTDSGDTQSLRDHCRQVSRLCEQSGARLGLKSLAALIGLLHDLGKATAAFQQYLNTSWAQPEQTTQGHIYHAPQGAFFAYHRWYRGTPIEKLTAQTITQCIHGHHAGLADCLDVTGESPLEKVLQEMPQGYEEAKENYLAEVAALTELDGLFAAACKEVAVMKGNLQTSSFARGMLFRLLLSILVDADRWDSACFEYGKDPFAQNDEQAPWEELLRVFERFRAEQLCGTGHLNQIRGEISDLCSLRAKNGPGIYTLSVPTGGGKTFSTLRYALHHAVFHKENHSFDRIFYIIPYNTILDQNAEDIRLALGGFKGILEHHANVVMETEEEQQNYRRLTERWDSPLILTSLVQFLNACFSGSNTDARRFYRLTNAVLIFDEIQSLPKHCKRLFELAVEFLTNCCGSTVVLCTATQPELALKPTPTELMPKVEDLYSALQRVSYVPELQPKTYGEAASALTGLLEEQSVLAVVNTKAAAAELAGRVEQLLLENGYSVCHAYAADKEEIDRAAHGATDNEVLCVHLSTLFCPAHRKQLISWVKRWTALKKRVFCVSTALIEAGINVSFPVVVRSLAGLTSIIQAGGRCNRNMEYATGTVYIWNLKEENLQRLPDISNGQLCTQAVLADLARDGGRPDGPKAIKRYYEREQHYTDKQENYLLDRKVFGETTLVELLSKNQRAKVAYTERKGTAPALVTLQSFRTAGQLFEAIPDKTHAVLVPYGRGREIIAALCGNHDMKTEVFLLRQAQAYVVAVYENVYRRLEAENALCAVGKTGAVALQEGFYTEESGLRVSKEELKLLLC